jgi:hypothetical protein
MKQYTNESQTAKLIELGFEKPKSISGYCQRGPYENDAETNTKMVVYDDTQHPIYAYSIGELIEKLPLYRIEFDMEIWVDTPRGGFYAPELIDALF